MKTKLFLIIKCAISLLLIYWLIQKGELSITNVKIAFSNLRLVTIFILITFCQLYIGAVRTNLLMQFHTQSRITLKRVMAITWAASFINCIAPSALFGELFKVKELLNVDLSLNKDNTFYALGFSKIFSIFSLTIITITGSLMVDNIPHEINWLIKILYIFFVSSAFIYIFRNKILFALTPLIQKLYQLTTSKILKKRIDNYRDYHFNFLEAKKSFFGLIFLSLFIQVLNTFSFLLIINAINSNIEYNVLELICVIPLGIFAMTLPISISGLGVGHLAFSKLLALFGIMNGADLFTIYFAYSYIFNLIGGIPFLFLQKKKSLE